MTTKDLAAFNIQKKADLKLARLKAVNAQLLEALKDAQKALDSAEAVWTPGDPPEEIDHWVLDPTPYASATSHIRAAIKAATENGHA